MRSIPRFIVILAIVFTARLTFAGGDHFNSWDEAAKTLASRGYEPGNLGTCTTYEPLSGPNILPEDLLRPDEIKSRYTWKCPETDAQFCYVVRASSVNRMQLPLGTIYCGLHSWTAKSIRPGDRLDIITSQSKKDEIKVFIRKGRT